MWPQHRRGVEGRQLLHHPLAHGPALVATAPELQVGVDGELLRGLGAPAALLRQPEEQQDADAVAAAALEHHGPRQSLDGLESLGGLLLGGHRWRPRKRANLDVLQAGIPQVLREEVLRRVQVQPRLVPGRQGDGCFDRQLSATSDIAGDAGHFDAKLLQRELRGIWFLPLLVGGPGARLHGLGELVLNAADHVRRYGPVDLLRVRQIQL
mmetsp:Transcript_3566/g.9966  ORF Transcript_3566/g.9966 Transcript_3566/m.9966 type:complete len:210 (-) Transcript_3566:24-653(-)